jgi:hypothetical protein
MLPRAPVLAPGSVAVPRPGLGAVRARAFLPGGARVTRRDLQIALGLLWLVDGGLQLQPFMLGSGFATQIIAPAAEGQPQVVADPVHWAASVIAAHPVACDVSFATVQLLLALGLLVPRTTRLALAASLPWSLGIWFFGEGLSGLASGHASLLTGTPGSVSLYALLALAAWPRREPSREAPARWLPLAWALLWIGGALFQALPGQNTGRAIAGALGSAAAGAPRWLDRLDTSAGAWIGHHGTPVVVALVAVEALIGLGALQRRSRAVAAAAGLALTIAIWVVGQDLGQLYSGQATDPNTAPLIALLAVALLAGPPRPRNAVEPEAPGEGCPPSRRASRLRCSNGCASQPSSRQTRR